MLRVALAVLVLAGCSPAYPEAVCVDFDGIITPACPDGSGGPVFDGETGEMIGFNVVGCASPRAVPTPVGGCAWNIGGRRMCGEDRVPRCEDGSVARCIMIPPANPDEC